MMRMARIDKRGLGQFDLPGFDFSAPSLPPMPPGPPAPGPAPQPTPAPEVQFLEPTYLFPVGAATLACPNPGGGFTLRDAVTLAVVGTSMTLPPGAQVIAATDPRCGATGTGATGRAPAGYAAPSGEVYGIPTSTLFVGGAVVAGIALLALFT